METIKRIQTTIALQRDGLDAEARTVPVTLATDAPIKHSFATVVLRHGEGALDLEHVGADGIPLLVSHNGHALPIGRIKALSMGDHTTTGMLHFGRSKNAAEVFQDVRDGIATDISVGADPSSRESITRLDDETLVIERWRPIEGSIVAVGADPAAKIHRSDEGDKMAFEIATEDPGARTAELKRIFQGLPDTYKDMHIEALESDTSVESVRQAVLDRMKETAIKVETKPHVQSGEDSTDKFLNGIESVIRSRLDSMALPEDKDEVKELRRQAAESEFGSYSLMDMGREWLRRNNVSMSGMRRGSIADKALLTRAGGIISHSGGDFASLVANVANKSLATGYEQAPTTWQTWCATGSLPDFKQARRANTSSFSDVDEIVNDSEFQYGTADDKHELVTMQRWGKLFSLGRTLLINDDLDALGRIPAMMGASIARKINSEVYSILSTNAAMNEDSVALFNSAHGNHVTSGAAPSVATLNAAFASMRTQNALGPDGGAQTGAVLNITPRYMLAPAALASTASILLAAGQDPAGSARIDGSNPYTGALTLVVDAEMDAANANGWYLAADPSVIDTITVFFLDGVQTPELTQKGGFTRDGLVYKIAHDATAAALDFRGLYYNDGVT